jgi:speckle-type POZ protein
VADIEKLLQQPCTLFPDFFLRSLDGGRVPAHRFLLSRCSSFADLPHNGEVRISATSLCVLEQFVRYVYTGQVAIAKVKDEVLRLAEEHGLPPPCSAGDFHSILAGHLQKVISDSRYCDVIISCGTPSVHFSLHKAALSCRCEYFTAMLSNPFEESTAAEIDLEGMSPEALGALVSFLYTDDITVTPPLRLEAEIEVLTVADRFLLPNLGDACMVSLVSKIDLDNVISIIEIAEKYSLDSLRRHCFEFLLLTPASLVQWGFLRDLKPSAVDELSALAFQKVERTRERMRTLHGLPLKEPAPMKEEDPVTWGRDEDVPAAAPSTIPISPKPKPEKKKEKKEEKEEK